MLPLLRWGRVCFSTSANLGGLRLCPSLERCPWAPQKEPPLRLHRIQHWQRRCSRSAPPPRGTGRPGLQGLQGLGALLSGGHACSPLASQRPGRPSGPGTHCDPRVARAPVTHLAQPGLWARPGSRRTRGGLRLGVLGTHTTQGTSHRGLPARCVLTCPASWFWKDEPPAPWVTEGAYSPTTASPPRGTRQRDSFSIKTHTGKRKGGARCGLSQRPGWRPSERPPCRGQRQAARGRLQGLRVLHPWSSRLPPHATRDQGHGPAQHKGPSGPWGQLDDWQAHLCLQPAPRHPPPTPTHRRCKADRTRSQL